MNYYNQMFVDWFRNFNKDGKNQKKAIKIYERFNELNTEENPEQLCKVIKKEVLEIITNEETVFLELPKNAKEADDIKMRVHDYFKNTETPTLKNIEKQSEYKALNFYFKLLIATYSGERTLFDDPTTELRDVMDKMYSTIDTPRSIYFTKKSAETSKSETLGESDSETSIKNQDSKDSFHSASSVTLQKSSLNHR